MPGSSYGRFGELNPLSSEYTDPVQLCVDNNFFNPQGLAPENQEKWLCPTFMAQRCSVKWDDYCEAYLSSSNYDSGGYVSLNKDWLAETAKAKYCRPNFDAPGAHCARVCEMMVPEGQSSIEICRVVGNQSWIDTKDQADLAGNFPQTARLNPLSPIYMDSCPWICDAANTQTDDALGPNDPVLNRCLANGACGTVLNSLAYEVVQNNIPVTNTAFQTLVEAAEEAKPINPNVAAKIAESYGIPAPIALEILKDATYGTAPTPSQQISQARRPATLQKHHKGVVSPTKESFRYTGPSPKQTINKFVIGGIIAAIIVVVIIVAAIYWQKKQ